MPLPKRLARFNLHVTNRVLGPFARRLPGFAVVAHVGRRSGRVRHTPVNLFRDGDRYVIALTYGADSQWVRNVLAAGAVDIETRGDGGDSSRRRSSTTPSARSSPHRSAPFSASRGSATSCSFATDRGESRPRDSATPSQNVTIEGTTPAQLRSESFPDLGD
jgi:deazaflavin-dependent oxidoreductase (nitroreductase family)